MNSLRFFRMGTSLLIAPIIVVALTAILSTPVRAQKADRGIPAWKVICTDAQDPQTCIIQQKHYPVQKPKGQQGRVGTVLTLSIRFAHKPGETIRKPYLRMQLPLGVDLRCGMVMRIDKGKETTGTYLRCLNTGCEVNFLMKDNMVVGLKAGRVFRVGFVPLGSEKVLVVEASLKGFTKAFNMLK